jgi:hypothetical protein
MLIVCLAAAACAFRQAEAMLRIDSPAEDAAVSGSVEIIGTADAPGMTTYRLEFAYDPNPSETWFLISEGTGPVNSGLLAVWDTSRISEGAYILRIAAVSVDGSRSESAPRAVRVAQAGPAAAESMEGGMAVLESNPSRDAPEAAFPAPTVFPAADTAAPLRSGPPRSAAFLAGAMGAFFGFALLGIRNRWREWSHQRFIRAVRKTDAAND